MNATKTLLLLSIPLAVPALTACGPPADAPAVDPMLGRQCFELHRTRLPPGSQYEGFDLDGTVLRVKAMTGTELVTLDCTLHPDGTLDSNP